MPVVTCECPPPALGRIEPFHPATGLGPPAPLAALRRRTRGSAVPCCRASASSSSFGGSSGRASSTR